MRSTRAKLLWLILAVVAVFWIHGIFYGPESQQPAQPEKLTEPEVPIHPNAVARPIMAVPGALVCSNVADIQAMSDLYNEHWGETQQDAMSHGQSVLLRGQAAPAPDPKVFGCTLLPPGTPVQAENGGLGDAIPKVTAKLPDGTIVRGLTFSNMLSAQ